MSEFISLKEAYAQLKEPDVVLVDCRFNLTEKDAGRVAYEAGHIPGAAYLDLEKDLSSPVQAHGGRHPLPNTDELAKKFGEMGIDEGQRVIAYDDQNGAMASRLWWLLKYLGHDKVQVLEVGFSAWENQGFPVVLDVPTPLAKTFVPRVKDEWIVDKNRIKNQFGDDLLVDSRAPERYRGETEPLDLKAGHIPGAINFFWQENVKDGKWKSTEELIKRFKALEDRPVTLYCGSGVTACSNFLALTEAGHTRVKLYPGSWSDWISYEENAIETGENKL